MATKGSHACFMLRDVMTVALWGATTLERSLMPRYERPTSDSKCLDELNETAREKKRRQPCRAAPFFVDKTYCKTSMTPSALMLT